MLVVTMTSNEPGSRISRAAAASTISSSQLDVGELGRDLAHLAQEQAVGQLEHVGLVHRGDLPAAASRASSNAARATRVASRRAVTLRIENAVSASGMNSPLPAYMLRSE